MSMVNISLNTDTKECVLVIDNVPVTPDQVYFAKGFDYDGNQYIHFNYQVKVKNDNGMVEHRMYTLPTDENNETYSMDKNGLAYQILPDGQKVAEDIRKFVFNRT